MEDMRHVIWSNHRLDLEDWRQDLESEYPGLSDAEIEDKMYEINNEYLGDERLNLDITLSRPILLIADVGKWDGRYSGYTEIKSGKISDCLYSECDYVTWYVDGYGDLRCEAIHHDGTNHYLYRVYKEGASEEDIDRLKEKIYNGTATRRDIERVTDRLGDEIGKVYGWEFPECREREEVGVR